MASKEKKTNPNNKKPNLTAPSDATTQETVKSPKTVRKTPLVKKLAANTVKKIVKKPSLAVKLKAKAKKPVPLTKKLTKNLLKNAKTAEAKQKLLVGNGVPAVPAKRGYNRGKKNGVPGKRGVKKVLDEENIKVELEDPVSNASDLTDISNVDSSRPSSRARVKKIKVEQVEKPPDYVGFLLGNEAIKKDVDGGSESGTSDTTLKPKKVNRKNVGDKEIKKECLEQTVIDSLDLNVLNAKPKTIVEKRRHSIEKFPISNFENVEDASIFSNLPRSISPKSKRNTRIRQSVDGLKRLSPYTRSDSPARILRNGKQRKLKDLNLLGGLDIEVRKRRRHCSDMSEISKLSGYESDSSFSDLASLMGTESNDVKEEDVKPSEPFPQAIIKRSLSTETSTSDQINNFTDTNSNLYNNANAVDINLNDKVIKVEDNKKDLDIVKSLASTPSCKVPEKSMLLDIMKQAFNNDIEPTPKECDVIPPSKFYSSENLAADLKKIEVCSGKMTELVDEAVADKLVIPEIIQDAVVPEEPEDVISLHEEPILNNGTTEVPTEHEISLNSSRESQELGKELGYIDEEMKQLTDELTDMVNGETDNPEGELATEEAKKEEIPAEPVQNGLEEDVPPVLEAIDDNKVEEKLVEEQIETDNQKTEEPMPILESVIAPSNLEVDKKEVKQSTQAPESAEEMELKKNIFQALGLQSLEAAEEAKHMKIKDKAAQKGDNYTGTLKTVIKLSRDKKKGRNSLKMTLQKNKPKTGDGECGTVEDGYKIMKESASTSWKHGTISSDTAGAHRKSHYSNRSNPDGSSEHTSDGETHNQDGTAKALVIPEKASSFSIHPGRLCKDECSYCFGKFGLFDTPCHIAQIKNVDRQDRILAAEKHLTRDSCLCDACYRHVDRKSNTPSYTNKSFKRNSLVAPGPRQNHCHVLGCSKVSTNILRRKWIIKMRKSICQVINIDLDNPGLHSIPICDEHYSALEHLMVCAMCKRRLARNHIHYLGPETDDLNEALAAEGVPLILCDKPVVCKLCKCFAAVILKPKEERPENSMNFFAEYKKRLLHFNDIVPMDEAAAEEPIVVPAKQEKEFPKQKKKKVKPEPQEEVPARTEPQENTQSLDQTRVPSSPPRPESPDDFNSVDYNTLIPAIAMDCDSDSDTKKDSISKEVVIKKIPRLESVKEAVEISKNLKVTNLRQSDLAVTKLGCNPSISVRQLFPGEEELPLQGHIDFANVTEKTPEGWDKCITTIQYDSETKHLWNELQKPYGNQSSFLRHLILLEKYFRNGDLILSSNASHHAINYSESVQNRLRAYDNVPSGSPSYQPVTMMQFNKAQKSQSGIITSKKELPPVTITNYNAKNSSLTAQLNIPPLIQPANLGQSKPKPPPGLISLNSNSRGAPVSPNKPQSQKIKFPITKNWRPNLIPIDPNKKQEKKQGLVQVISGGKPYHITFEDYKKMCAIKRSFEMREKNNKRLQEAQQPKPVQTGPLKTIQPRKGLTISKTAAVIKTEPAFNDPSENETILDKLDKHVENIGAKGADKASLLMPKIPKSLTVIPQTVARKTSRPTSPVLIITQKNNTTKS